MAWHWPWLVRLLWEAGSEQLRRIPPATGCTTEPLPQVRWHKAEEEAQAARCGCAGWFQRRADGRRLRVFFLLRQTRRQGSAVGVANWRLFVPRRCQRRIRHAGRGRPGHRQQALAAHNSLDDAICCLARFRVFDSGLGPAGTRVEYVPRVQGDLADVCGLVDFDELRQCFGDPGAGGSR